MSFKAKALFIPYSPERLRLVADVIRGKSVVYAMNWLKTYENKRTKPIFKVVKSAVANAKDLKNVEPTDLFIEKICVDRGPIHRYYKPGAQGRSVAQRRRLCHISVCVDVPKSKKTLEVKKVRKVEKVHKVKEKRG